MNKRRVLVVGIGDCGIHILEKVAEWKLEGIKLLAINTDRKSIDRFQQKETGMIKDTLLLGGNVRDEIRQKLQEAEKVILISGIGGGTGTSVTPIVAEIAKNLGCKVIVMPITPFRFELKKRIEQAERCLEDMKKIADLVLITSNDILLQKEDKSGGIKGSMERKFALINGDIGRDVILMCEAGIF